MRKKLSYVFILTLFSFIFSSNVAFAVTTMAPQFNGTDPNQYVYGVRCADDARTVKYKWFGKYEEALMELRYSPTCRTAWARITLPQSVKPGFTGYAQITREQDGLAYSCYVQTGRTCYTPQVDDAGYTSVASGWYNDQRDGLYYATQTQPY